MSKLRVFFCIFVHLFCGILCRNAMFDDSMRYDISWAGALRSSKQIDEGSRVTIMTKDNEHYHCSLLKLRGDLMDDYSPGPGPSPEEMLKPLTTNARCSYRLDAYWTYELCHGAHVRQYHDEKPRSQALQQFFLGKAKKDKGKDGEKSAKEVVEQKKESVEKEEKKEEEQVLRPKHNFQGREVPYYEVVMDNGTACELVEGKPRQSRIIYICKPDSHNEIVSVKEIESCVYQLEVLTPLLCASDMYKVREDEVHSIRCYSLKDSPTEPQSYVEHIVESEADRRGFREYQYMPVQGEGPKDLSQSAEHRKIPPQPDQQLTQDFLNGDYCLRGGSSGWWLYEYCHGRHVQQYHQDQQGKTIIYLGQWNTDVHRDWAKKNPNRKSDDYVTHYYGNGEICDLTGMARTVQVKLRCKKSNHLQEVSIYLVEPNPCQYILGVDSPILCPLIKKADEDGIFPTTL